MVAVRVNVAALSHQVVGDLFRRDGDMVGHCQGDLVDGTVLICPFFELQPGVDGR
jgi:hypothetical protein